jgi:hypothetical protein
VKIADRIGLELAPVGFVIGFDLSEGTTNDQGHELLAMMNLHITHLTLTGPGLARIYPLGRGAGRKRAEAPPTYNYSVLPHPHR